MKKIIIILFVSAAALTGIGFTAINDVKSGAESYNKQHPIFASPISSGDASLFTDGKTLIRSLYKDIKEAQSFIYIHFFIIRDDAVSKEFFAILQEKAEQGVDVKLSVDAIGGNDITKSMIRRLEKSGVQFAKSRPLAYRHFFYRLNHRNHRKIAVIDGKVSYIGGFNIGEEYLGNDPRFGYWRDYHVRLSGSGSREITKQFLKDWKEDTGKTVQPLITKIQDTGSDRYQFVFSTGDDLEKKIIGMINHAKSSIMIATPYFIPTDELMKSLLASLKRGVKVELLIPDKPDYWYTKPPSYPRTKKLLKKGAVIYLYREGFFHGKVMVIDNELADIGTANWDKRSFFINDEANCLIYSKLFISETKKELRKDFSSSRILTEDMYDKIPFWERLLEHTPEWIYELF
nr:cardiolipin synthase [Metabacillus flavus]